MRSPPANSLPDYAGPSAPPMLKANGVHLVATGFDTGENHGSLDANAYPKLEALRAQGQALSWIAQALIMQTQALNKQFDALCSESSIERSIHAPT
jgi:hypothetical protein